MYHQQNEPALNSIPIIFKKIESCSFFLLDPKSRILNSNHSSLAETCTLYENHASFYAFYNFIFLKELLMLVFFCLFCFVLLLLFFFKKSLVLNSAHLGLEILVVILDIPFRLFKWYS